jgi:hypothetical protein
MSEEEEIMEEEEEEMEQGSEEVDSDMSDGEIEAKEEELEDFFPEDETVGPKLTRSMSFEVLKHDTIIKESKNLIDNVVSVCGVSAAAGTAMLRHFK